MIGFADYYGKTLLHPAGLISVLFLGMGVVLLPRRYAIHPMILVACFIPVSQRLIISGLDLDLLRILILFAWVRLLVRKEYEAFSWNRLDSLTVAWMLSSTIIYTLCYGTASAFINRLGAMSDILGMYLFFRCVLRDWQDFERVALGLTIISIPVAAAFLFEFQTARNIFAVFGGVPEITTIRQGRLRCQGAFVNPILAGCFWASVTPWMAGYSVRTRNAFGWIGIAASLFIVMACASSTPVMSLVWVLVGFALYPLRKNLRGIRWVFFAALVILHFIMRAPVWHLIARINVVGGSSGWHRYKVMDAAIRNFSQWWLLGESDVMGWGIWEMRDVTNQYVLEGLRGGLLTLLLFIAVLVVAFGFVGRALRTTEGRYFEQILIYCIGVSLFVHTWTFFGLAYFGQLNLLLSLNLAMVGCLPRMLGTAWQEKEAALRIGESDVEVSLASLHDDSPE